jgi:hypothetical protein
MKKKIKNFSSVITFRFRLEKIKGSGITTCLFFQGLCETSNHSAWTSSTCKKKGDTFWVYCLSLPNGWKCCRYLGISNQVAVLFFMAVSIRTARLLLLYALAKKHSAFYFHGCFYRGSKCSIAICLSQRIVHSIFMAVSIRTAVLYCYML